MTEPLQGPDTFGKKQILQSARFSRVERDALNVVLKEDQTYSLDEAREMLKLFLNKEVI
ncbi:hypothetical protein [Paenibacillus sp. NFR01]|uniref:hypothetical protein n=1 Tax=Paenibacillus sp. NFR01 TaxID=1566279 RepID=UPI0008AD3820|nr:hypothetical protein [Paenibacillus sp. NFR01]SEU26654.1 hypothetical protein SAMN03159358_4530 [Paenibacillus sp. NFR01]